VSVKIPNVNFWPQLIDTTGGVVALPIFSGGFPVGAAQILNFIGAVVAVDGMNPDQINVTVSGGGGSPGGVDTAVQFNSAGTFAGDATNFSYTSGTQTVAVKNLAINGSVVTSITNVADANYVTTSTDYRVSYTSITADRNVTLSGGVPGREWLIKDQSGNCAVSRAIIITPTLGTIDGVVSATINVPYGVARVYTDGTNYFTE
jgi:hypothetical protein